MRANIRIPLSVIEVGSKFGAHFAPQIDGIENEDLMQALKTLAKVLEDNPDIKITVEGHTDIVPVRTNASFADNWDLSVKRATSIVRILLDNSSIDPTRLVASGRGEFLPVDPANTPEARQKNRRTEIILTPRLDELYRLLK